MGTVYRKAVTKAMPPGAELFTRQGERFARWKTSRGKTRTAPVTTGEDGTNRLKIEARTFTAKYRDGAGVVREAATGCRDEQAARAVLADLERRAELVRSGFITAAEDAAANHQQTPLADHVDAYITHLSAKGATEDWRSLSRQRLERVFSDCGFQRLGDVTTEAVERWLADRQTDVETKMTGACRNAYRKVCVGFGNWAVRSGRLQLNPFAKLPKADERVDSWRKARAMTEPELLRLLSVARQRPLAERGRETEKIDPEKRKRKRDTWRLVPLTFGSMGAAVDRAKDKLKDRPELIGELETIGRERELIYKVLVLTGLRQGELQSVTVKQVQLEGAMPHIQLDAADEKNRQGNSVPLRADLAADLSEWLADKLETRYGPSKRFVGAVREALPPETPLFNVPDGLVQILDRDLRTAGIPKVDERGCRVHIHAMRHTFGTMLAKSGVPLRTAQEAMRHSDPKLTANVYTDPKLLDIAGALDALPTLPLNTPKAREAVACRATGTEGKSLHQGLHQLQENRVNPGQSLAIATDSDGEDESSVSGLCVNSRCAADNPRHHSGRWESNPHDRLGRPELYH